MLRLRSFFFVLSGLIFPFLLSAQSLPPEAHGGNLTRTIDLTDPARGTIRKTPVYVYDKENPGHRTAAADTRNCQTVEVEATQQAITPGATQSDSAFESWMRQSLNDQQSGFSLFRFGREEVLTIPVVVHVIYSSPLENISDAQVLSQIEALNRDYRRQNADAARTPRQFQDVAVDTKIEFCLVSQDPNGNPTNGIDRVSFSGAPFTERYLNEVVKPVTIWDPSRYCNIWVCRLADNVLGFAQFPVSSGLTGVPNQRGTAQTDGVVIHYSVFGTTGTVSPPFNLGRTTTHEMGHWLGLRHTWGDGPCGIDDFCGDTPEAGGPHFNCQTGAFGCNGTLAMVQNYMDYSDDACMNLFTQEQKDRMRLVLKNSPRRGSVLESAACASPLSPPEPDFLANVTQGCAPLEVQFSDRSEGEQIEYQWTFPGGRPGSSNKANPMVSYREPGVYPVSLRVSNAAGTRSVTREGLITVAQSGQPLPLALTFEDTQPGSAQNFRINNPNQDYTWGLSQRQGGFGQSQQSIGINLYDNNLVNSADWFLLPVLDFSAEARPELSFDLAYAPFNEQFSDTLGVFIATDCGTLFRSIYYKGGEDLATVEQASTIQPFAPEGKSWRQEHIDLSFLAGRSAVQIAFVTFSGNGNDLFLDNIRVGRPLPPPPTPDFTLSLTDICAGETVQLSEQVRGDVSRYVWSFPGGQPASDTTATPTIRYDTPGSYDVILTALGPGGERTVTKQAVINVRPAPPIQVSGDREICAGEMLTLQASGGDRYHWVLDGDTLQSGNNAQWRFQPLADATLTVIAEDARCRAHKTLPIRVRQVRPLMITPAAADICAGESILLEATGAMSYLWSPAPSESDSRSGSLRVQPTQTTTYQVRGVTEAGCALQATATVTVHTAPDSLQVQTDDLSLCPGQTAELVATGANSYRWSPTAGLSQTEGAAVTAAPLVSTTYRLEGTNSFGCLAVREVRVEVSEYPNVQARSLQPNICRGETATLQARGATTYRWLPASLTTATGAEVQVQPESDEVFTVIGQNAAGCADTAQVVVQVREPQPLEISASDPVICPGGNTQLQVRGARNVEWVSGSGLSQRFGASVSARPSRDETYRATGLDAQGCPTEGSITIRIASGRTPVADFTADRTETCAGQTVTYRPTNRDARGFRWEFPGGEPAFSTDPMPTVTYAQEGFYPVRLAVIGCNNRTDWRERPNFMLVTQPIQLALNTDDRTVCRGETVTLVANGAWQYRWEPSATLDRREGASVIARPLATTTYKVTGIDADGCEASASVTLEVVTPQTVDVQPTATHICRGQAVSLEARGGVDYRWSDPVGRQEYRQARVELRPEATTTYALEAFDRNGCRFTDSVTIRVSDSLTISLEAEKDQICQGDRVMLRATGAEVVSWSPASVLSSATGKEVQAFPTSSTTFRVVGTNAAGCKAEASIDIEVDPGQPVTVSAQDSVICPAQGTLLSAEGGVNFRWSPSTGLDRSRGPVVTASPLETTTYTVVRDEGGCGAVAQITVEVQAPAPLQVSPTTAQICEGDQVRLQVQGGNRYVWDVAEGLNTIAGANVTVRPGQTTQYLVRSLDDRGCELQGTATVVVTPRDFLSLSASANQICAGESVELIADGAASYEWLQAPELQMSAPGKVIATPAQDRRYQVIGESEGGCRDSASIAIAVRRLQADFRMEPDRVDLAYGPGLVRFTYDGDAVESRTWTFGSKGTSEESAPLHVFSQAGNYPITLHVSDGICEASIRKSLLVENSSSLEAIQALGEIQLLEQGESRYTLSFESPRQMYLTMQLLDDEGREVLSGVLRPMGGAFSQSFDFSQYPAGLYYLRLNDGEATQTLRLQR